MALSRKKKKSRTRTSSPGFSVTSSPYQSQADFDAAVNRSARNEYAPQLSEIRRNRGTAQSASDTRQRDITSWYGAYANDIAAAYQRTQDALNNLIATTNGADQGSQATMRAALNYNPDQQLGQIIGGPVQRTAAQDQSVAAGAGSGQSSNTALARQIAAVLGQIGGQGVVASAGMLKSRTDEAGRLKAQLGDFDTQRRDILSQVPAIREKYRQQLYQQELERQNQAFTQNLSEREFGLSQDQFNETKRSNREQEKLNWAQLDAQIAADQAAADQAADDKEAQGAQARAEALQNGKAILQGYLDPIVKQLNHDTKVNRNHPKKNDPKHRDLRHPKFAEALTLLTGSGYSEEDALYVLAHSPYVTWRRKANDLLHKGTGGGTAVPGGGV